MKSTQFTLAASLVSTMLLAGCVAPTPHLDEKFGEAVNTAKAQQTINPDASRNTNPVAGIDGQAANAAIDRYHKSYERPAAQPSAFTIGIGAGTSTTTAP
jgi:outer membrane murein-binding lipoprotein Lpp